MVQIVWSGSALSDLRGIYDYISRDSIFHARAQIEHIETRIDLLTDHPRLGKAISEFQWREYRELVVYPYRVIYRITENGRELKIIAIAHGRRMMFR